MVDAVKILGSLLSNSSTNSGIGGQLLQGVIQSALSGSGAQGGIVGSLLGSLTGSSASGTGSTGGGLGGLISGLTGQSNSQIGNMLNTGDNSQSGGLGSLLSSLSNSTGGSGAAQAIGGGAMGAMAMTALNSLLSGNDTPEAQQAQLAQFGEQPSADQNAEATLLIRAMTNAAKADGEVDAQEQENILGKLGEATEEELNFVRQELAAPLDAESFINSIPRSLQQQVYASSLLTINLDTQQEAGYLHQMAQGFGISPEQCNQIHEKMGAPLLYKA